MTVAGAGSSSTDFGNLMTAFDVLADAELPAQAQPESASGAAVP